MLSRNWIFSYNLLCRGKINILDVLYFCQCENQTKYVYETPSQYFFYRFINISSFLIRIWYFYKVGLGDPEVTANLYCNFAYPYWNGWDSQYIFAVTSGSPSMRRIILDQRANYFDISVMNIIEQSIYPHILTPPPPSAPLHHSV